MRTRTRAHDTPSTQLGGGRPSVLVSRGVAGSELGRAARTFFEATDRMRVWESR